MRMRDTKKRILHEAIMLFGRDGYERVSVRQIAWAVGIKESSIYNHYSSKEVILEEIMEQFVKRHMSFWLKKERFFEALEAMTLREALQLFFYRYPDEEYEEIISMYRIVFMEQYRKAEFRDVMLDFLIGKQRAHMEGIFTELIRQEYLKPVDPKAISQAWVNVTLMMVIEATHVDRVDTDPQPIYDLVIDMVMRHATEKGRGERPPGADECPAPC